MVKAGENANEFKVEIGAENLRDDMNVTIDISLEKNSKIQIRLQSNGRSGTNEELEEATLEEKNSIVTEEPTEPIKDVAQGIEEETHRYVIDASIAGTKDMRNTLDNIRLENSIIILTSITIRELRKLELMKDFQGLDATFIMNRAIDYPATYKSVLIDETFKTPDDCIVKYCADNNKALTLLTADKEMALNARMYGIDVQFMRKEKKKHTLFSAEIIKDKLCIANFYTSNMSIRVYSDGIEYNSGIKQLEVGDDVLLAKVKDGYIVFSHFRITSLEAENNCERIFTRKIVNTEAVDCLKKEKYRTFIKDFKYIHNL